MNISHRGYSFKMQNYYFFSISPNDLIDFYI